jgi:RNA recognition motif-containing protein
MSEQRPIDRSTSTYSANQRQLGKKRRRDDERQSGGGHGEVSENKLYIGNLDSRVNEFMIIKLFKRYGKIVREEVSTTMFFYSANRAVIRSSCGIILAHVEESPGAIVLLSIRREMRL